MSVIAGAMAHAVVLRGVGLHTGARATVTLRTCDGSVVLRARGREAAIAELTVASTVRSTTVEACGRALRVGTVEHAFAALAGSGIHDGVALEVDGPEMPLLDGGAAEWCDALATLLAPRNAPWSGAGRAPRLRVAREATIAVGASRYAFVPGAGVEVEVRVELDDARLVPDARWAGDRVDFRERIAPARTFVREDDMAELVSGGLARHVAPESVVVLAPGVIHHAGRPFAPDEPARHKLLDLVGDAYVHGGPPIGRVSALRPGHSANATAFRRAREEGILVAG